MQLKGLLADTRPPRNPHFRRLWDANAITVVGAQLTIVAVPAQVYAITGSSAYVGLTGVFGLVPLVVFGLWGGRAVRGSRSVLRNLDSHTVRWEVGVRWRVSRSRPPR